MKRRWITCLCIFLFFPNCVQASKMDIEGYLTELRQYRLGNVSRDGR